MGIMDIEDYIKEAHRQLSYISNYQKLNIGLNRIAHQKKKTVTNNYNNAKQISSKNSFLSDKIKKQVFYLLIKIYKPNNPRRTDISSVNCHANRISEFDYH